MSEKVTGASLRISTNEGDVGFISDALGVVATWQFFKGEHRSKQNPASSVFEESLWIYESPLADSVELHEHIERVLSLLESNASALERIRSRIVTVDIFCMFSSENGQGSAELGAGLLRRLADQNIDLIIDLYPNA